MAMHDVPTPTALATLMHQLGISQSEIERRTGMSRRTVGRIFETGRYPSRMDAAARHDLELTILAAVTEAGGSRDDYLQALDQTASTNTTTTTTKEQTMLMSKQTLSQAARKAFRLFTNPFDGEVVDDSQMFSNAEVAYVRQACLEAATGGRFVALVGESGAGKTTILGDLEARLHRDRKPVVLIKPYVLAMEDNDTKGKTLKSADILASIISTLDPRAPMRITLQGRAKQAQDLLTASAEAGHQHLLVIEEAHSMPDATIKHLKRIHEMRLGRKPLLGILLIGQTELAVRLDPKRAHLREVTQRCEMVQLMPLDSDLMPYLKHRAEAAGRKLEEFVDERGLEEIRARLTVQRPGPGGKTVPTSLVYPLAVNNMITACLNVAADLGVPVVTRDVVRSV